MNMANFHISKPKRWFSRKQTLTHDHDHQVTEITSRERELREVFHHLDMDKDGKISCDELRASFASVGEEMGHEEASEAIANLDKDGDGLLDFGDFMSLMERRGGTNGDDEEEEEECIKKAFEAFEAVKGSGKITPRGVQRLLRRIGDERTVEECEGMIRAYDLDGNGELDFQEFHRMMCGDSGGCSHL